MTTSTISRDEVISALDRGLGVEDIKVRYHASYRSIVNALAGAGREYEPHMRMAVRYDRKRQEARRAEKR